MNPLLISAVVAGAIGFGSAWQIQSLRADSLEKTHVESQLAQEQKNRATEAQQASNVITAQNLARARESGLRADADGARASASRLRGTVGTLRAELSAATANACFEPAAPSGELLDLYSAIVAEQADEATELAGQADRHASDVETLSEAWPK